MNFYITHFAKILLAVAMGILIVACEEKDTEKPNKPDTAAIPKIASLSWSSSSGNSGWEKFTYDAKGRIAVEESATFYPSWDERRQTKYQYTDTEITATTTTVGYEGVSKITYILNNNGLAIERYFGGSYGGGEEMADTKVDSYSYDANGYMIQEIHHGTIERTRGYTISDGNIYAISSAGSEYLYDRKNTLGLNKYGRFFFGKDSKNLYKRGGPYDMHSNEYHQYEFDSKGRAVKDIRTFEDGQVSTYTYVYVD